MAILALPLAIAAAASVPATRVFWRPEPGVGTQPAQVEVEAELVLEGRRTAVYRQLGYAPAAGEEALAATVRRLEDDVMPRLERVFGPFPDRDGNGRLLLLVCETPTPAAEVFGFDLLGETEANRRGLHSNQGEVVYHPFAFSGNRTSLNDLTLSEAVYRLLHIAAHPATPAASRWLAGYIPFYLGQASPRWLWGDADPLGRTYLPHDPWAERGWSVLFLEYVRERLGDSALAALQAQPLLATRAPGAAGGLAASDLLGDFAMACWLDDQMLAERRFGFRTVAPPRPLPAARGQASRPSSGLLQIGAGGMGFLVIEGSGERSLPLALQGDPEAEWSARAVRVSARGPDRELEVSFGERALARLELPPLARDEFVVVAVAARPADSPGGDRRILPLHWGVGWVPHIAADDARDRLGAAVQKALPDGGKAARERLAATVARLTGDATGQEPRVTTRYAFAPEAGAVVEVLRQEAERRGLRVEVMPFVHRSPAGVEQDWRNVLIELPGRDARRWPVVVAAHWDAVRGDVEESSVQALSASDNAAGVATVLEAAGALSRRERQSPVLVAFLAGGRHGAAGAAALLAQRQGRLAAWIEVDEVGIPQRSTRASHIRLEAARQLARLPATFVRSAKEVGLVARVHPEFESTHTGVPLAAGRGIPAFLIRARAPEEAAVDAALPLTVERQRVSYDLLALVAKALADAVTVAAGGQ
ncbi:MAG TPA: M28 family peptidase [Thermoanaerobaculaceae bacterium]|nr:M28 family peptidase [Thermoanaerobaculaceae bacterium]HRS14943.1 M28 family peptidase [Thermoanaerobaculaceae bacterium]